MAFERIKTEIGFLLTEMQNEPQDAQQMALLLHGQLRELAAFGLPAPQDLVDLESALDSEIEQSRYKLS